MRFLTCHPNQTNGYIEEAEKFYANPSEWLEMEVVNNELYNPTHVVAFDVLAQVSLRNRWGKIIGCKKYYSPVNPKY